jgi:opacity protein-like surface antigen
MKFMIVLGLAGLVFVGFSTSARGDSGDTFKTVGGGLVSAAVIGIGCAITTNFSPEAADDDYARRGWLVGIGGSYAIETFSDDAESGLQSVFGPTASYSADDSLGINGGAGYRCHRYFGADVDVEWISSFDGDVYDSGLKVATLDVEALVVTANAKGYFPIGRYHPFLSVGAGGMMAEFRGSVSDDVTSFTMRFGGGLDIYATTHIVVSLGVDYVFPLGSLEDLDYISIGWGLQYRF